MTSASGGAGVTVSVQPEALTGALIRPNRNRNTGTSLRSLAYATVLIFLLLLTGVFAYSNPQPIDVDIGFTRFEQIPMAVAFAITLALGWLLGVLSAGMALWRSAGEKRRLKQDLKYAEAELRTRPPST